MFFPGGGFRIFLTRFSYVVRECTHNGLEFRVLGSELVDAVVVSSEICPTGSIGVCIANPKP